MKAQWTKRGAGLLAIAVLAASLPSCGADSGIDVRSYQLGSISSWSEAINVGIKELALGSPATSAETDALIEEATTIAGAYGIEVYREPELMVTDLFPAEVTEGKEVLLLYRPPTLDKYLALKEKKAALVAAGEYSGKAREDIARGFGRLLSYPDSVIDQKLRSNGVSVSRRATFDGVWKSPTISLDDQRWTIPDLACRNGCSLVGYEYMGDLLADPANDDTSVVDLYADTQEFNRRHISTLTRPVTLQKWANYDAANDAALDCTPEGDGLQHQIGAPPAIQFEQHDDRIVVTYEYWNAVRTFYLDGRSVPEDTELTRLGYSIGRFEGDELVVRTYRLKPAQINLMGNKFYMSEETQFEERYSLSENGERMEIVWSVIDPVNLRAPYTGMMSWLAAPGWELDEWHCEAITGEF